MEILYLRDRDKKYFKSMRTYEDANHKDKAVYVIQRWFIKNKGRKYYLLSFIPFLRKEKFAGGEIKYYLFSFIPILKIKIIENADIPNFKFFFFIFTGYCNIFSYFHINYYLHPMAIYH